MGRRVYVMLHVFFCVVVHVWCSFFDYSLGPRELGVSNRVRKHRANVRLQLVDMLGLFDVLVHLLAESSVHICMRFSWTRRTIAC